MLRPEMKQTGLWTVGWLRYGRVETSMCKMLKTLGFQVDCFDIVVKHLM